MRKALPLLLLLLSGICFAQTTVSATFTWTGSTDSSQLVQLSTVNGQLVGPTNFGEIQIVNQQFLWLLDLPESLGFPNNGYLDCEAFLNFGPKVWGTRPDGTIMDGTKVGDTYTLTGATTSCPMSNGSAEVSVTRIHQMIQHRSCWRRCATYLVDTEIGGAGKATGTVVAP